MKKTIISISLILLGCSKSNNITPTNTTVSNNKVWCFYQMNYGNKMFYYCAKSEQEYNSKYLECINNNLDISIDIKTDCNQCQ